MTAFKWNELPKYPEVKPESKLERLHFLGSKNKRYVDKLGQVFGFHLINKMMKLVYLFSVYKEK